MKITAQKMKFSIKGFFSTFTEEILNGKLHFFAVYAASIKLIKVILQKFLFNIIPVTVSTYNARNTNNIPQFKVKHNFFRDSFFPSVFNE